MINQVLEKKVKSSETRRVDIADTVGITRAQLWNYINGQMPNVPIANSLARYFNMHTEDLFPYYSKPKDERYGK